MNPVLAATGISLIVLSPSLAIPRHVEDLCFYQAGQISFNGRGDREHFIANCIADNRPTPPAKRGQYKKSC